MNRTLHAPLIPAPLRVRLAAGLCALAFATPAAAQEISLPPLPQPEANGPAASAPGALTPQEIENLPPEYRQLPVARPSLDETTSIGPDGIETITRTRRIPASDARGAPQYAEGAQGAARSREIDPGYGQGVGQGYPQAYPQSYAPAYGYGPVAAAPAQVLDRARWIEECNRRTNGLGEDRKGGIIGGLLGAIGGGVLGNRLLDSERLVGTLLGGAVGGIGGFLLGDLIGGGKKEGSYDCEAALDSYMSQYGSGPLRIASRSIPVAQPVGQPIAAPYPAYGYPAYQTYYAPPQQMVMVPISYQQPQRVIVRENVREELVPGAARTIPPQTQPVPVPAPRMIKQAPSPKLIKQ